MSEETASSVISSVLGFVSREIQDFVVSAVTGTATISSQPLGSSSSNSLKHKRSKSAVRSASVNGQSAGKRSRRPSVSRRDDFNDEPSSHSQRIFIESDNQENLQRDVGPSTSPRSRDGAPSRQRAATKGLMGPPPTPPLSASRPRTTMPGSLFPRSPTPAEFRNKPLPPPVSPRKPAENSSPDSETRTNRGRRSASHVRFDPVVVRRIDRPRSPPASAPEPAHTEPARASAISQLAEPAIKVEDDDEIQILDRMPSPPRGRDTAAKRILTTSEASSSRRAASPYELVTNHADMSISEFSTQEKGKAKETFPDDADDSESARVQALMDEIRRLKSELANQSSTKSSFSMPPPAPPAPPPPPPGYIAIPATSWKNGAKHPSQRAEVQKKEKRKSLQSTVPLESMEAFLSELKTVKLRSTGVSSAISPMTRRRQQNASISSAASDVSSGLLTLRAQLKRKDVPDADRPEIEVPRNAPRRRLEYSPPRDSPAHQDFDSHPADNLGSTSLSSGNDDTDWRNEGHSMSWSFPGPSRSTNSGRFANRPAETRPKPSTSLASSRNLYDSRLDPLRHGAGLAGSDMTTPSLCSDTEEHPQESFKSTQPEEDLLTPCEDEMAGLQPAIAPSGPIDVSSRRTSDLHLDELIERRYPSPPKKQVEQRQPPRSIRLAKRTSHPPPVEGSPNVFTSSHHSNVSISRTPKDPPRTVKPPSVFTSRPPKSPLPKEPRPQKPKPPRASSVGRSPMRNTTATSMQNSTTASMRNSTTTSLRSTLTQSRSKRSSIPSTLSTTPTIPAPEEAPHSPQESPSPPSPSLSPNLHPIQLPLPDPRYATFRKSTGLRTARNNLDASLYSLDDELRAVSANERIAELDLDMELADMDMDMTMTMGIGEEEDVFSGTGIRGHGSGFTSGGGGGGIAVTSTYAGGGGASRSRIPVMGRSR